MSNSSQALSVEMVSLKKAVAALITQDEMMNLEQSLIEALESDDDADSILSNDAGIEMTILNTKAPDSDASTTSASPVTEIADDNFSDCESDVDDEIKIATPAKNNKKAAVAIIPFTFDEDAIIEVEDCFGPTSRNSFVFSPTVSAPETESAPTKRGVTFGATNIHYYNAEEAPNRLNNKQESKSTATTVVIGDAIYEVELY